MEQSVQDHVDELRSRLLRSMVLFVIATLVAFYYSPQMLEVIQSDLSLQLNALRAYEVFYTQIMLSVLAGLMISLPVILYQLLMFAKPGLKDREYRALRNYLPFSVVLFIAGAAFGYRFIVKQSFEFFQQLTDNAKVEAVWGLQSTLGFAIKLSAFTGVVFQIPIVSLVLARIGLIDAGMMKEYRAYFIVSILLLAAVTTPPDVLTQSLVTIPVIALYQISIWLVSHVNQP